MLIVRAGCKPYTATPSISTSGWAAVGTGYSNGTTNAGNGLGSVEIIAFWKIAASASETSPVIDWGTTSAPGVAVAVCYQKGAGESWDTPTGAGGGDDTVRTSQTATIESHITVASGDMVDFFVVTRDDSTTTNPTITQAGVTFDTVAEYPATAIESTTSNDIAADGGYRLATAGTSSAAAVVTHTNDTTESGAAWQTRLRLASPDATATPAVVAAVTALPSPTEQAGWTASVSVAAAVVATPTATASGSYLVSATVVTAAAAFPTPTVVAEQHATTSPASLSAAVAVPSTTRTTEWIVSASTVTVTAAIPTPTVTGDAPSGPDLLISTGLVMVIA
jgi:hypothetical protein